VRWASRRGRRGEDEARRLRATSQYPVGVSRSTFRIVVIASSLALAAIAVAVALSPSGSEADLPPPIESVFPPPGDTVVRQTAIEVDLPVGYRIEFEVDGTTIPAGEIGETPATGVFIWQPGPTTLLPGWSPGDHTVTVRWERTIGSSPDIGTFTWTFRVV